MPLVAGLPMLSVVMDALSLVPHIKQWVVEKRLPNKNELEPLARGIQSLEEQFNKSLKDEIKLKILQKRVRESDPLRASLIFQFLQDKDIPAADKTLFREIVFFAEEMFNADVAYQQLCELLYSGSIEGIQTTLNEYRSKQQTTMTPEQLIADVKRRWKESDEKGFRRNFREWITNARQNVAEFDQRVTDEELEGAKNEIKSLFWWLR